MTLKVVLASSNQGKIAEIQAMLSEQSVEVLPQSHFAISDADETGTSFIENAIIKARHAARLSKLPAIADDSGLAVDALNGAPGVYSARYAGLPSNDQRNTEKLLLALEKTPHQARSARFHCVMVFMASADDPAPLVSHGVWQGTIAIQPSGANGFGYDPVFYIPSLGCSSAELEPALKNSLSHRAQALKQLLPQISDFFSH
ncbi:MAG: RdgB/HAM1 family non-canonical purine NTP pyrophosphatase [Cycloclasticus sp.]|nr:RdgB/HAM1 family non-canonical purine NTP pyrophosphatase [Cycloclasticus sp.]MBQ0790032.1 RdgB/HAM1 family non-canonical purine NTP pyrophosphatase [Cycloclasticus sp.]